MRQHRFFARKAKLVLANLFFRPGQGSKGQAGSRGVGGVPGGPKGRGPGVQGSGGCFGHICLITSWEGAGKTET